MKKTHRLVDERKFALENPLDNIEHRVVDVPADGVIDVVHDVVDQLEDGVPFARKQRPVAVQIAPIAAQDVEWPRRRVSETNFLKLFAEATTRIKPSSATIFKRMFARVSGDMLVDILTH